MENEMPYDREKLERIITKSCADLLKEQPMLFREEEDINERTVSGELSSKLKEHIDVFHINCEYNRMTDENGVQIPKKIHLDPDAPDPSSVFPDIIIHRQEDRAHNLLIIEIKMSWKNSKKEDDFKKLDLYMKELHYQYGLYLELGADGIADMVWYS